MKTSSKTSAAWALAICVSAAAAFSAVSSTSYATSYEFDSDIPEYVELSRHDSRIVMGILERAGVQHNGSYGARTLQTEETVCSKIYIPGFPIRCTAYLQDTHLDINGRDSVTLNNILKKYGAPCENPTGASNVFAKNLTCSQSINPGVQRKSCWFEK